jgi:hypothetical protein
MSSELSTAFRLKDVLYNRRWTLFTEPFKHLIVPDIFVQPFYLKLEKAFQEVLDRGLSEELNSERFSRNMKNYDAYGVPIPRGGPFEFFLSQELHDKLDEVFGANATGDMTGALHHHKVGGRNGFIHNDLNPAKFPARKSGNRKTYYNPAAHDKGGIAEGPNEHTAMRAVSVIYYLNNKKWSQGDGGETGLYTSMDNDAQEAAVKVPPINNLLMAFQCSPYSYHAFMSNLRHPRNSIIVWLHSPYEETVNKWGKENFVWWDK